MTIALKLLEYLEWKGVEYQLVRHPHTDNSMASAETAHVPGDRLAKCVVLEDERGYLLAVIPATHHVELEAVKRALDRDMELAGEQALPGLFPDCEPGAVPPVGGAYGYEVVVDESLEDSPDVYFEAGDHTELVHVSKEGFAKLMAGAERGAISRHI